MLDVGLQGIKKFLEPVKILGLEFYSIQIMIYGLTF